MTMTTGICPKCKRRMVLVSVDLCQCSPRHVSGGTPCPKLTKGHKVVRAHSCGKRLIPGEERELTAHSKISNTCAKDESVVTS